MLRLMLSLSTVDTSDHTCYHPSEATRQFLHCLQIHKQTFVGTKTQMLVVTASVVVVTSQGMKATVTEMVAVKESNSCLLNTDSKLHC